MIKFSILIPAYNSEKYIVECLDSVLNQTYANYEVIIIDDGSTDNSRAICDTYCKNNNNFFVYSKTNQGLLLARKDGILHASGDYLIFLDSDDTLVNYALETINNAIIKSSAEILIFNLKRQYKGGSTQCAYASQNIPYSQISKDEFWDLFLKTESYNSVCTKAIQRTTIINHIDGIYREINQSEDAWQTVHFIGLSNNIVYLPVYLYNYRMRKGSLIHTRRAKDIIEILQVSYMISQYISSLGYMTPTRRNYYKNTIAKTFIEGMFKLANSCDSYCKYNEEVERLYANNECQTIIYSKNNYSLKYYNVIRLWLLRRRLIGILFCLDKFLGIVKSIVGLLNSRLYFD